MIEDNVRWKNPVYSPFFGVFLPKSLTGIVEVVFSNYDGPVEIEKRPIANIRFNQLDGFSDELLKEKILLQVYITHDENNDGKDIQAYKGDAWENLGGVYTAREMEYYSGYLLAVINVGDPPIAVG